MSKSILIAALLIAASLSAGCRRVVLVSFTDKNNSGLAVDTLAVTATDPVKEMRVLGSLSATLGYFDISTSMITLHTVACGGDEQLADEGGTYTVMNDAVVVGLSLSHQNRPCPIPGSDAGYGGDGGADGGSEVGATGGSGAGGSGGGTAGSGSGGGGGGMTIGLGGADGGDTRDSAAGDTGDAGADSAECGTDTHAPACDPPTPDGTTAVGPPATYSVACQSYCMTMQANCTGANAAYDDMETCQRYCNEAGWPTTGNGRNTDNSLECRAYYANVAATVPVMAPNACAYAGPSGGNVCGTQCDDFCTALSALCPTTSHLDTCMSTCGAFPMGTVEPQCRFAYLQKTVMNRAFCDFANFGSCLSCAN